MATRQNRQTIQEYLKRMDEDGVDVRRWKAVKVLGIAMVFLAMYYVAVDAGADPTGRMFWAILMSILLVGGVEVSELEMLHKLKNANISIGLDEKDD